MIYTGKYDNFEEVGLKSVSISGDRGMSVNWQGAYYKALAPKLDFWKIWHSNIGKISEYENNKFYIESYYDEVLSKLDPNKVFEDLDNSVLLCYEDNVEFCHRHIVAYWLEYTLGVSILEIKLENSKIVEVSRPEYIKKVLINKINECNKKNKVK